MSSELALLDQANVYGVVAPVTVKSMPPFGSLQMAGVMLSEMSGSDTLLSIVKLAVEVQLPPALTVTV